MLENNTKQKFKQVKVLSKKIIIIKVFFFLK